MINEKILTVLEDQQKIGQEVYKESLLIAELRTAAENLSGIAQHPDATAIPTDLAEGVIAYGKQGKIVGELPVIDELDVVAEDYGEGNGYFYMSATIADKKILEADSAVFLNVALEELGDATAEDVVAGKIFTSAAGVSVVGTGSASSNLPRAEDNYF